MKGDGSGTVTKRCGCAPKGGSEAAKARAWRKCQHSWSVRYYAGGKLKWESFRDETAARARSAEVYRAKLTGEYRATLDRKRAEMSFTKWAEQWIASPGRNDRTRVTYRAALGHIAKSIGNATVRQVADDRNGAKRMLADAPGTYAAKMRNVLTGALNAAVDDGMIRSHSLTRMKVDVASTKRAEWEPTTDAQRHALATGIGEYGLAVWTAYHLGLRAGESLALRKSDFLETIGPDGPMTVLRLTRQRQVHAKDGLAHDTLKGRTADDPGRYVPVPPELARIVKDAPVYDDDGALFPPGFNSTMYARMRKARKAAGLPSTWSLHDLRHEYVSNRMAEGVSIALIAQVVGHTSTVITSRIYGHQTVEGLAAVLRPRRAA